MRVLYVDVYFLINFTIDIVALFISSRLLHISTCIRRLALSAALGGTVALIDVLCDGGVWVRALCAVLFLLLSGMIISKDMPLVGRIRFIIVFMCIEMLLAGAVWYGYRLLDRYLGDISEYIGGDSENRSALIFSVIVLLAIGVLKLFIMVFSKSTDIESVRIKIQVCGKEAECDALVDSGNLVKDPMNMNPVIFLKRSLAETLFPKQVIELSDIDGLDPAVKRRIRLIPITRNGETHVMTGMLADNVIIPSVNSGSVSATLAFDKEEGDYGGLPALVPSCLLRK